MKLVDVNVLLYAVDERSPRHDEARAWLDGALGGSETIAFSWIVLMAFLRLSTHPAVFPNPLTADEALDVVDAWLGRPTAVVTEPGPRHVAIVRELLVGTGTAGNLVTDAHLAALAIEAGAELVSYDTDFARFPRLRWVPPAGG